MKFSTVKKLFGPIFVLVFLTDLSSPFTGHFVISELCGDTLYSLYVYYLHTSNKFIIIIINAPVNIDNKFQISLYCYILHCIVGNI